MPNDTPRNLPSQLTSSVNEAVPLQLEACTAGHALLAGQLLDCLGKLECDRPRQIGRQVAHSPSVIQPRRGNTPHRAAISRQDRLGCVTRSASCGGGGDFESPGGYYLGLAANLTGPQTDASRAIAPLTAGTLTDELVTSRGTATMIEADGGLRPAMGAWAGFYCGSRPPHRARWPWSGLLHALIQGRVPGERRAIQLGDDESSGTSTRP